MPFYLKLNMQEVQEKVTRFNSKNAQNFLFPALVERVAILEDEKFLFLPKEWSENQELVALKFIAELKGYEIDYAENKPTYTTGIIFQEIENAIKVVMNLELKDYAVKNRTTNLFYARLVYSKIASDYSINDSIIGNKINKRHYQLNEYKDKHNDLFKFDPKYRRIYNDVMQVIKDNKVIHESKCN